MSEAKTAASMIAIAAVCAVAVLCKVAWWMAIRRIMKDAGSDFWYRDSNGDIRWSGDKKRCDSGDDNGE